MARAHPIQLYRAPPPAASPKPWVPAPAAVAPKAGLIPAGLRGPKVQRRRIDTPVLNTTGLIHRIRKAHMDDASTLRTIDPSPRVFVRAKLTHLFREFAVFVFALVGFIAAVLAALLAMGPQ